MKILIRVDDFPRVGMDCEKFREFHSIMSENEIRYLLGITPNFSLKPLDPKCKKYRELTKEELSIIKKIKNRVSFAMHGVMHQTLKADFHSEFIGLDEKTLEERIKFGLKLFRRYDFKTNIIIPPFNTFDLSNLQIFKKYFKIVTGGPETIKIFGKIPPGNLDGIMYIPSYRPFYGKGKEIYKAVKKLDKKKLEEKIICITFHWGWEIENNFKYVEKICEKLKNNVIPWNFNLLQTILY